MRNFILGGAAMVILSGCALAIPTHNAQPPQSLGKHGFRFSILSMVSPVGGPDLAKDGFEDRGDSEDPSDLGFGFSLAYGFAPKWDVEVDLLASFFAGDTNVVAVKYQWLGSSLLQSKRGEWVGSVRGRYIRSSGYKSDSDTDDDSLFDIDNLFFEKLEGQGFGIGQTFGYHALDWFLLTLGVHYTTFAIESRYRDGGSTGPLYTDDRDIDLYGGHIGFCFLPRWTTFALSICNEYGVVDTEKTFIDNERASVATSASTIGFNWVF